MANNEGVTPQSIQAQEQEAPTGVMFGTRPFTPQAQAAQPQVNPQAPQVATPVQQQQMPSIEEVQKATGLTDDDLRRYDDEIRQNGLLSEASYTELQQKGIPKVAVDRYINGSRASAAAMDAHVHELVGGKERFEAMIGWARENLTQEQKEAYTNMFNSGNPTIMDAAIAQINAGFSAGNPQKPNVTVTGGAPDNGGAHAGDFYRSTNEMIMDMQKDEYWKNPEFQRKVQEKIMRAKANGIDLVPKTH